jgi:hypothetical protein
MPGREIVDSDDGFGVLDGQRFADDRNVAFADAFQQESVVLGVDGSSD